MDVSVGFVLSFSINDDADAEQNNSNVAKAKWFCDHSGSKDTQRLACGNLMQ